MDCSLDFPNNLYYNCNTINKITMRAILNVSLPPEKKKAIEERAKQANKTVSAYIIYAVELEQQMISEDELVEMAKEAQERYDRGEAKVLKSLEDLLTEDDNKEDIIST